MSNEFNNNERFINPIDKNISGIADDLHSMDKGMTGGDIHRT